MTTIELYINNRLVDIESPDSFSIYLKRLMITPAELSKKDAQKSYDITLPATKTNNEIFGHINVEEVKDKFARLYDARLWVGGVNIFEGKFKLSGITRTSYKGNLGVPAQKSTKDIFGDKNMNEAPEFLTPFESISDITKYNKGEKGNEDTIAGNPRIIFPFVLYGLMDKGMVADGDKPSVGCSPKNVLDGEARFRYHDFKPSVNCVELLSHLFKSEKLTLTGTALDDERINKLYASYKNPNEYDPKWPQGKIKVSGTWKNGHNKKFDDVFETREMGEDKLGYNHAFYEPRATYIKRLLSDDIPNYLTNTIESDTWGSVDLDNKHIFIPVSGLYKIKLKADVVVKSAYDYDWLKHGGGDKFYIATNTDYDKDKNANNYKSLHGIMAEVKLLRNMDTYRHHDNTPPYTDNVYNRSDTYCPKNGEVNFVEKKQNDKLLCGLSWGRPLRYEDRLDEDKNIQPFMIYKNPIEEDDGNAPPHNLLAAPNTAEGFIATACDGYWNKNNKDKRTDIYNLDIADVPKSEISINGITDGKGEINQVVWLDVKDTISPIFTSSLRKQTLKVRKPDFPLIKEDYDFYYWTEISMTYELEIEPFKYTKEWLKVNEFGNNSGTMDWDSPSDFNTSHMNITNFLPSNVKINDWIDNFCKAFNLELRQTSATEYQLNVKDSKIGTPTANIIDLDSKMDVKQGRNQSLSLPYVYDLGFTVDKKEAGYWNSMKRKAYDEPDQSKAEDGGGKYYTQSPEEKKLEQKSSFSYNWFKTIYDMKNETGWHTDIEDATKIDVPIIADKEAWANTIYDYGKYNDKRYFDKAQRFWYRDKDAKRVKIDLKDSNTSIIEAALVQNDYKSETKELELNYKNEPNSIMTNFFLLLADAGNSYTTVECFLTPEEYASIADSWARYNGDLYYVAEVDGYDPTSQKPATLKLIRKML